MAEAITYADLRFVKAPLKKSISTWLGQDPEAYEDGELTYENVQIPSAPEGPVIVAPVGLEDKTGVPPGPQPAAWSKVTPAAAGRVLPCCAAYTPYFLLGLLLTCLLLAVASICLGVRYMQVSQQLRQTDIFLEVTNSSLHKELHQKITQLGHREEELQGSRKDLAQNQKELRMEQGLRQSTEEQLRTCHSDKERTQENFQREQEQRNRLEQRMSNMRETLRALFPCSSTEKCCPVGWLLKKERCFHLSHTPRSWEESRKHCQSLSSDLAIFKEYSSYNYNYEISRETREILKDLLSLHDDLSDSLWVGLHFNKNWHWIDNTQFHGFYRQNLLCGKIQNKYWPELKQEKCSSPLPLICEMAAFRFPDVDFLHFEPDARANKKLYT